MVQKRKFNIYILSSGLMMQSPLVVNTEVAEVLQKRLFNKEVR